MLGSLLAIVMGPTTPAQPLPALSISSFNFVGFIFGIAALLGLELLKADLANRKQTEEIAEKEGNTNES